jgi:ATP-binding cassette subfamily C (CFTR/MRP) protein 1
MLHHLIKAPINLYHDTVPKGQIFNRLSNDLFKIDIGESFMFYNVSSYSANLLGQVVVCAIFQPYCLILVPFIIILGLFTMRYYLNCSREISRLESISRSPMLNSVNETVYGALTIRAYKLSKFFIDDFRLKADNFLKTRIFLVGIMNWYTLMLDFLSYMFIVFLILFSIFFRENFAPATIGILLTYCVQIQDELVRYLTCRSNLENDMVGLERCIAYTKIISEKPEKMPIDDELGIWPKEGKIKFENYSVQYRPETEIVLKNLNFEILPKEKIGIVGRTGSGKSTIANCLFRILEAKEGKIYIDDIDISQVGLTKLRSNITIIPQDPTLMEGSLRFNIDPLNKYTDEEIQEVMEQIGFWYICVKNIEENINKPDEEKGLNMLITGDGGNISIGERQLICITRAILRKSKIIVMDEATASIDVNTENIIQKAIKNILNDSTILTIAHRIKTVLNSDRILVLDNGEIKEFDTPKNLLENKNSMFYDFYNNISKSEQ